MDRDAVKCLGRSAFCSVIFVFIGLLGTILGGEARITIISSVLAISSSLFLLSLMICMFLTACSEQEEGSITLTPSDKEADELEEHFDEFRSGYYYMLLYWTSSICLSVMTVIAILILIMRLFSTST